MLIWKYAGKTFLWIMNLIGGLVIWGIGGELMAEGLEAAALGIGILLMFSAPLLIPLTIFWLWSLQKALQEIWIESFISSPEHLKKMISIHSLILLAPFGLYFVPLWNLNPLVPLKISGLGLLCALLLAFLHLLWDSFIEHELSLEKPKRKRA